MSVRPPETQEDLAAWIKSLRQRSPLTQNKVAAKAGIEPRRLRAWEKKALRTHVELLHLLSALGVAFTELVQPDAAERVQRLERELEEAKRLLPTPEDPPAADSPSRRRRSAP